MPRATRKLPDINALLDGFTDPAVLIGRDYRILAANQRYQAHYGVPQRHGPGSHCYEVSHHFSRPCDEAGETCPLRNSLATGQTQRVLHLHYTQKGEERVAVETMPIRDARGEIAYFLEILRESGVGATPANEQRLVGRSPAFLRMLGLVERAAPSDTAVLLLGESGTGKEMVALALHEASRRAGGPFVPVECSGLTESLFESELFGHEKGSFTGAHARKTGLVEAAHGGTLFLDEVADIPLSLQVKLLRLLETQSYRRVGGTEARQAEFRLICATHADLRQAVREGRFRQDLYYRISTFPIALPPLRERGEDLELVARSLLDRLNRKRHRLSKTALACLGNYDFPGNVRELRNILERAVLLCDGEVIGPEHLPEECGCGESAERRGRTAPFSGPVLPLEQIEREYLHWALAQHDVDKRGLAKLLGLSERSLYRRLKGLKGNSGK
ncbi:MAG: sigma-54 interaction domain-containing protein [Gammaproteobacteria bacterium]